MTVIPNQVVGFGVELGNTRKHLYENLVQLPSHPLQKCPYIRELQ